MKKRILIEAHTLKIPALDYGGTERVIYALGKQLFLEGYHVAYLVKEGSTCDFADIIAFDNQLTLEAQLPKGFDLYHFNGVINGFESVKNKLFTIHGNVGSGLLNKNVVFISKNHAARCGSDVFVYNGLDWSDYPVPNLNLSRSGYHFLGKAKWKVKNFEGAVAIALQLKENLFAMGAYKWRWHNLKKAFFKKINPSIKYLGMVNNHQKIKIIEKSKGLIFPVLWHEPFGLAIIESLYGGAPVFGTTYGSLPELITDEVGAVADNINDLVKIIANKKYSAVNCHKYAKEYFSADVMALNYIKLYDKILSGESLHQHNPQLQKNTQRFDF